MIVLMNIEKEECPFEVLLLYKMNSGSQIAGKVLSNKR